MKPYYQDDFVTLYHGDARDVAGALSEPDVVLVTDPPYGVDFVGKATKHTDPGGGYISGDDGAIGPEVVAALLPWVTRAAVFTGTRLLHDYPKPDDMGCVYCPSGAGRSRWGFLCFNPILFYGARAKQHPVPTSISSFATADAVDHPCPKPLAWMRWLVDLSTRPDEVVLDPFAGSGTTLRAAKDLGLRSIGVEREERYCEVVATRCAQEVLTAPAVVGAPQLELDGSQA